LDGNGSYITVRFNPVFYPIPPPVPRPQGLVIDYSNSFLTDDEEMPYYNATSGYLQSISITTSQIETNLAPSSSSTQSPNFQTREAAFLRYQALWGTISETTDSTTLGPTTLQQSTLPIALS